MISFNTDLVKETQRPYNKEDTIKAKELTHQYISQRVFKDKSMLCRIAIPYISDEDGQQTKKENIQRKQKTKITKKIPKYNLPYKNQKAFKPFIDYQKTPINEYLNYELSEQINIGLKEVKVISQQIKHIKEQKKKDAQNIQEKKVNKNIRIRPTKYKNKKLFKSASATFFR